MQTGKEAGKKQQQQQQKDNNTNHVLMTLSAGLTHTEKKSSQLLFSICLLNITRQNERLLVSPFRQNVYCLLLAAQTYITHGIK